MNFVDIITKYSNIEKHNINKMQHKEKSLKYYIHKLTHVRRDYKYGGAPHKPIMLLSIIFNIEIGKIKNNKIFILPELVGIFKKLWSDLVESERHHCIFALPFYHMRTEVFWTLFAKKGFENMVKSKIAMKSFSSLNSAIKYAEIDIELFNFLKNNEEREVLKLAVLDKYFPNTKNNFSNNNNYINDIENEILNEPSAKYKAKLKKLQNELKNESFEEEKYIRSNIFKRQIPILYQNTCAVSDLQINATLNISMIDACHIIPFSHSYDDTISNGISLTPTLHRAFDRGLISFDNNYKLILSNKFNETNISQYSIKQFEGKRILLPKYKKYYPNIENLIWHRKNIFKN